MRKITVAQVGMGSRAESYWQAIITRFRETTRLVAICDTNPARIERVRRAAGAEGVEVAAYSGAEFERMLAKHRVDLVVVTSKDSTHDRYITAALAAGADVVAEKPLTTDEVRLQRIIDAVAATGRTVRVTFNYRYSPVRARIKELIAQGVVGRVLSVDFHWNLDTSHGADYYRRWHRNKESSGGLLVHKATHHFDLVNWWLDTVPETVYAAGKRDFYTPQQAERYELDGRSERCHTCGARGRCGFFLDLAANENLKSLYLDSESHDGYFRDRCVFSGEIDIEDTMCLVVRYRSGALMSYSLNSFLPWEGYRVAFNGSRGRLEHDCRETVYVSGDGTTPGEVKKGRTTITLYPHFAPPESIPIPEASGSHGGGDDPMLEDIFGSGDTPDPLGRRADYRAGAWSVLTGIAANRSIATGRAVDVATLVTGLALP